ncbi:MAG: DUF58 domain-containing protein [Candidatus Woesearchaeota archaeon]
MVELNLDFVPHIKKLEDLTKKPWLTSMLVGSYSSVFKGGGIDFEGYSVYTPEQDSRYIDWKASSKGDKVLVRTFIEERDVKCFFVIDVGSNMFYSSSTKLKCEFAAEIVNELVFSVIASSDQAGLYMCSSKKAIHIPPKTGKFQYFRIVTELSNGKNYGGERFLTPALSELFKSKDKGILFIVSDFLNATKDELNMISLLKQKFEVFVIMVRDKMERYLPKDLNAVCIEDLQTGKSIILNIKHVRDEYQQEMAENERFLEETFLHSDVDFAKMYTNASYLDPLIELFEKKKGKW